MKVLLINPPSKSPIMANTPPVVDEEGGTYPPLGLLYVASYARKTTPHEIKVIDSLAQGHDYDRLREEIEDASPDLIGITALTFTLIDVRQTAKLVKAVDRNIPVVLGGPHAFLYPDESIAFPEVDYVISGEGEMTFVALLKNIGNIERLKEIRGLVSKRGDEVIKGGPPELIRDLDSLPFPARDLVAYQRYNSLISQYPITTTMMTSRGCPYRCLFCARPHLGRVFRPRSSKNVVDEMESCTQKGIFEFLLYDDTFTLDRERVLEICREIGARSLNIAWDIRARVDLVDAQVLKALRKAGCLRIHYGVEAGTDEILRVLRKGITTKQVREVFRMTKEEGISILAYFMLGSPGETREQIQRTLDFSLELKPDFAHFSITIPFPGTELYRLGLEKGVYKRDYWQEFAADPRADFVAPCWEENLSREELWHCLKKAYKSFYARPSYILKELSRTKSLGQMGKKLKAGIRLLRT